MPTAVEALLKIDGIIGEVKGGFIDILSFTFGLANSGTGGGTGGGGGKVSFNEFNITKHIDKATPELFKKAVQGMIFPNVTLEVTQPAATGGGQETFTIKFHEAFMSSYKVDEGKEDAPPVESISFVFGSLAVEFHS